MAISLGFLSALCPATVFEIRIEGGIFFISGVCVLSNNIPLRRRRHVRNYESTKSSFGVDESRKAAVHLFLSFVTDLRRRVLIEKREKKKTKKRKGAWRGPDDEPKIRREQSGRLVQWCHVTGSSVPSSPPCRRLPRNFERSQYHGSPSSIFSPLFPSSFPRPSSTPRALLLIPSSTLERTRSSNNGRLPSLSDSLSMLKETSGHHEGCRQWISAFKAQCRDTVKIIRADLSLSPFPHVLIDKSK